MATNSKRRAPATLILLVLAGCATGGPGDGGNDESIDERMTTPGRSLPTHAKPPQPDVADDGTTPVVVNNAGSLCTYQGEVPALASFTGEDATTTVEAGDQLAFQVALPDCLSSSCDVNRVAVCEVAVQGDTITVRSHLAYEELDASWCTMDCGVLAATCTTPPLAAGSYTVVHGDRTQELTVPSTFTTCAPADECVTDDDCDGWCGVDENGHAACKAYAQEGAKCGMYAPPAYQTQCDPSLVCVGDPAYLDLGGFCLPFCMSDAECKGGTSCVPYPGPEGGGYCDTWD